VTIVSHLKANRRSGGQSRDDDDSEHLQAILRSEVPSELLELLVKVSQFITVV